LAKYAQQKLKISRCLRIASGMIASAPPRESRRSLALFKGA
jgi:hypothetical protein